MSMWPRRKQFGGVWYRLERTCPHNTSARWFERQFKEKRHRVKLVKAGRKVEVWVSKKR